MSGYRDGDTVGKVLKIYKGSARLRSNAQSVQLEYGRVIDLLIAEIGATPLGQLDRSWLRERRDQWAVAGHRAATIRLQVLKNALEPDLSDGRLDAGLFRGLQRVHRPHGLPECNPAWTEQEFEAVLQRCLDTGAEGLARGLALGRYAGLRRQTICSLREEERYTTERAGRVQHRLRYRSEKGEVRADFVEDPLLTDFLDQRTSGLGDTVAYNKRGYAWNPRQLNQALDRVIEKLAAEGAVRAELTLHGLRHARGVELAHAGLSDAELMAQMAHSDEQSARVYRRQAYRSQLADRGQRLVDQHRLRAARGNL